MAKRVQQGPVGKTRATSSRRPQGDRPKIAIIGAGIAGLYCGYRLKHSQERNFDFTTFEASDHIGGRIWSTRLLEDGRHAPDSEPPGGNARDDFKYGDGRVEFVAEFGPMRIELDQQDCLRHLLLERFGMDRDKDFERFPPYQSPVSDHDPKYEMKGEEAAQETPLDLLKLAVLRIGCVATLKSGRKTDLVESTGLGLK